jgi:hypothetical protein
MLLAVTKLLTYVHFDGYPSCERKEERTCSAVCVELFILDNEFVGYLFSYRESYFVGFFHDQDIWNNTKSCG